MPGTVRNPPEFVVSSRPVQGCPKPVIAVDGPVRGADISYDHHATGEPVNLDTIPADPPRPGTLATTMLDTDAVISAAVVLLRADGLRECVERCWAVLYEAAHMCDHLIPSGLHPTAEQSGLGLHCWLKEKGMAISEVIAWAGDELRSTSAGGWRPAPQDGTRSRVFHLLSVALVSAIARQALPCDYAYLDRLAEMEGRARASIRRTAGQVTVLEPEGFIDALALYRAVQTDVAIMAQALPNGGFKYGLGVHPRAYDRVSLEPVYRALSVHEAGWGGRANAGGSPMGDGSRIGPDQLVEIVRVALHGERPGGNS